MNASVESVDEACVLSIVLLGTPRRVLQKHHLSGHSTESCQASCRFYNSILLGSSVINGLKFEPAWLSEPSEPVSRMQRTKRRMEQFSVHTSCSVTLLHVDVGARLKKPRMSARMTSVPIPKTCAYRQPPFSFAMSS